MKTIVNKIKRALAAKDMGAFLNHYWLGDETIIATDGRITAGAPSPYTISALVPGPELEALASRLDDSCEITQQQDSIELRSGRMHGHIQTLPPDTVAFPRPEGEWQTPPPTLIEALRAARPFIAEQSVQQWALCACLRNDMILASNNISLVQIDCPTLETPSDILVPSWAVDFIIGVKATLTGMIVNPNHAAFLWEDGLWLRTQLVEGAFPTTAANLLTVRQDTPLQIAKDWRSAYKAVAEISDGVISIGPERITGGAGRATVVHETPCPGIDVEVHFNPKFLNNVMAIATHWAPGVYPKPIPFCGPGAYGLVMGRQK